MHMPFVQNVPFFSIMLCMVCGIASAMFSGKVAKWLTVALSAAVAALNLWLTIDLWFDHRSFTYMMGHFPAPWGNELRGGLVESTLAVCFSLIMLLSGEESIREVITFPMNKNAQDLMMDAPTAVEKHQLDTVHIALIEE